MAGNPDHLQKGGSIKVEPIKDLKDTLHREGAIDCP